MTESDKVRWWQKVIPTEGCWHWTGAISQYGYGVFEMWPRTMRAHRVGYEMLRGEIVVGGIVCHTCDNRSCVNPDHLYVGTHRDNTNDARKRGRMCCGEKHPLAKMTGSTVADMRASHERGETVSTIARRVGVDRKTARKAITGDGWKHIEKP